MISVSKRARDDGPRLIPRHSVLVMEDTLKFEDRDRRMGIVELNGYLLGEVLPVFVRSCESDG